MNNNHNQEPPPQNGPPPMVRPNGKVSRTMKELCQPSINGRGGPIASILIQATDFGLRHHMIQQDTINAATGGTFMQKTLEECYELIKNMTAHLNHWDISTIRDEISRNISSTSTTKSPEADLKAITTHSGVTLTRPSVSPSSPTYKEVDREPETIMDQVLIESTNNVPPLVVQPSLASSSFSTISSFKMPEVTKDTVQLSTKNIQPPVAKNQILIDEPVVAPKPKPTIPYPSRVNKQKLCEKDDMLALKFLEIFRKLHFELSFADALLHMPKFALMFKSLLNNKKKLFDLATTLTGRTLIDVYGEELTLHVDDEAITFKVGQTSKYSFNDAESISRIDVIYVACEEYVQEVLRFSYNFKSGNPTPISDPIIAISSPSLTPFKGGDFLLEEIEACLISEYIPPGINDTDLALEGDIRLLKELLNKDPS
nr:reverse transcriptase domain-containing protein [Tanacetum cinerariifolium]